MLQIRDIRKEYRTGNLVQKALDGVSLNLRDNEFVAILGPSGSGKTTLLNIIGGLDRYDSGDLIINGVSTKRYKDRDWDSYRNHTIGFVFQSYNLIMHQTVLSNVELALTISGISGSQKRERAKAALRKVGLGDHMYKKPNQMSGGQMQRVAIARALVNDPDIVLADEPTGALDSDTSIQVMELLQEVAKDRLVVMVTHNPELAAQYATRTVTIKDGHLIGDTDPYRVKEEGMTPAVHKNLGHASMSFLTALQLSFNNLKTKKARTLLVSFAGSIGIIGIALILSLSTGVNQYIEKQESDTLAEYPLQIQETGYDLSSFLTGSSAGGSIMNASAAGNSAGQGEDEIGVMGILEQMFSGINNNDLASLKTYLDSGQSNIEEYTQAIQYIYDVTPEIYRTDGGKTWKVNPNELFEDMSGTGMSITSMMSTSLGTDVFYQLPSSSDLYEKSYELVAGEWPTKATDLLLVLSQSGNVSDLLLYETGILDQDELSDMLKDFSSGGQTSLSDHSEDVFTYDDFLGMEFQLVSAADYYEYDEENNLWTDRSEDAAWVNALAEQGITLTITGIIQPGSDAAVTVLTQGIGYQDSLVEEMIRASSDSEIVKAQLENPEVNVFTGNTFEEDANTDEMDLSKLFAVDEDAMGSLFGNEMDLSSLTSAMDFSSLANSMDFSNITLDESALDLGSVMNTDSLANMLPSMSDEQIANLLNSAVADVTPEQLQSMTESMLNDILNGYAAYAGGDAAADISRVGQDMQSYLGTEGAINQILSKAQEIVSRNAAALPSSAEIESTVTNVVAGYLGYLQGIQPEDPYNLAYFQEYLASSGEIAALYDRIYSAFVNVSVTEEDMQSLAAGLYAGYTEWAAANGSADLNTIGTKMQEYLATDEARAILLNTAGQLIDTEALTAEVTALLSESMANMSAALESQITAAVNSVVQALSSQIQGALTSAMSSLGSQLTASIGDMFTFDPSTFADLISSNLDTGQIRSLITSLISGGTASQKSNLAALGYVDLASPVEIDIYPKDFEAKNEVVNILNTYNQEMRDSGQEDKVITYTDLVATMMSSVTDIINAISYVLIAFVAISLIVSSIMIGVITYISVLERKKEIGILRAIGASKRNVAQVFNAETFITGALAGGLGVGISALLTIPINHVIYRVTNQPDIRAVLPVTAAGVLVVLSIGLTLIAGLMPANKAAKSDPVTALRSE